MPRAGTPASGTGSPGFAAGEEDRAGLWALISLLAVLLSDTLRKRLRVFLSKHFFQNRYDYRDEWRSLTQALYQPDESKSLGVRSIEAVARIFDSRAGFVLLRDVSRILWQHFEPTAPYAAPAGADRFR